MAKILIKTATPIEADAFAAALQYVNESSIEIVGIGDDFVLLEDTDKEVNLTYRLTDGNLKFEETGVEV